ncbi:MAG TPA: hypothetical protein PKN22_04735 [Taishania sp.]|nr:hypothetical protein [Taishania sp.]
MKHLIFIALILWGYIGWAAPIDITEAIATGKIKVLTSYEKLGNNGVILTLTNLQASPITIVVPAGTLFKSSDEEQELLNIEEQLFVLQQNEQKKVRVGGYCTQLKRIAPRLDSKFTIGKTKNTLLLAFLEFLKTNQPSKSNYQEAVWALTDKEPIESIEVKNDADTKLREFIAKKTNRTNPWYYKQQSVGVTPGRPIERRTIAVSGHLDITTTEDTPFRIIVVDLAGKELQVLNQNNTIEKNVKHSFRFALTVQGWQKGKYKILIQKEADKSTIKAFDFEV